MDTIESIDIIIPAYNEEEKIADTINAIKSAADVNIIVVDDKSTDNTVQIVKELDVEVVEMPVNGGKGKAVKAGLEHSKAHIKGLIDADLGTTASEVEKLIEPILLDRADFTIARFGKARRKGGFGLVKGLAAWGVKKFTGEEITTTLSGQRIYRREVIDSIEYIPDDFGIEIAMTVYALKNGYRLEEVDVDMTHSETGRNLAGFKHRGKQFYDILKTIIKLRFKG